MRVRRSMYVIAALGGLVCVAPLRSATAQSITTVAIRGTVRSDNGGVVDDARVRVVNTSTGLASQSVVRHGRFFVQGMEVGGPYVVEVRHIGFLPQQSAPLFIALGESPEIHFVLRGIAVRLDPVSVSGSGAQSLRAGGGTATLIPDSLVHRLPTPNRNFYDFVRLAPQVSTKVGFQRTGVSAAGANLRFNNYLINGVDERFINANLPAAFQAGKSIPLDAVKEFQVLIAPYDVRYGDFAGALVNTVTQSGTNQLRGSIFGLWRSDRLARGGELADDASYDRMQYGLTVSGPIVRNRVHFFLAPEFQRFTSPAAGPYIGQPASRAPPVPVDAPDVERLGAIMRAHGLTAGSGGMVRLSNPLRNLFARVDAALPWWNSRMLAFASHVGARNPHFSRVARDTFSLDSYHFATRSGVRLTSVQLHTDLPRGRAHNELVISSLSTWIDAVSEVQQPVVRVQVAGTGGNLITLNTGTAEQAQGQLDRSRSFTVRNDVSIPLGARNVLVVGAQAERFNVRRGGIGGSYGAWTFSSLDALERGIATRYELRKDLGSADAPLPGIQYALYVSDEWRPTDRLAITIGARADLMDLRARAPFTPLVDSLFGRRTDAMPRERVHLSPRLGFAWQLADTGGDQLRGGIGVFTGRPPRGWLRPAVINYGVGIGHLKCGSRPGELPPPFFVPDYRSAPTACANGAPVETAPLGAVDLLDGDLRMAQSLRASLAYDRQLPWSLVSTTEALATRYLSDFMFVNLNLAGPQRVDRFGRVLYGTISPSGVPLPKVLSGFESVIDLRNTGRNYSYQISTRLERRFANRVAASAAYTYSRTRDVQSPSRLNLRALRMWGDARALSGTHEHVRRGISLNDLPHRVVSALGYTTPWSWPTAISLYYVAESGSPFTYVATGNGRLGDLNADGSDVNDPIYVPRDAGDNIEIVFSGYSNESGADNSAAAQAIRTRDQQAAFARFIERTPCLARQRGTILQRNSCREPWSHTTTASVRQTLLVGGRGAEVTLDVFNVLNLLNGAWGRYRVAEPRLLEHVGYTPEAPDVVQPVFRFDATRAGWTTVPEESAFHLQLGVRYRF